MTLSLSVVLAVSALMFGLGVYGALTQRNAIRVLMCIELVLNSVNINLVAFSRYVGPDQALGQVFTVFVMTVAAAEAAVGLAIILMVARRKAHIDIDQINLLTWYVARDGRACLVSNGLTSGILP